MIVFHCVLIHARLYGPTIPVMELEQLQDQNHHNYWDQLEHKHDLEKEITIKCQQRDV